MDDSKHDSLSKHQHLFKNGSRLFDLQVGSRALCSLEQSCARQWVALLVATCRRVNGEREFGVELCKGDGESIYDA